MMPSRIINSGVQPTNSCVLLPQTCQTFTWMWRRIAFTFLLSMMLEGEVAKLSFMPSLRDLQNPLHRFYRTWQKISGKIFHTKLLVTIQYLRVAFQRSLCHTHN